MSKKPNNPKRVPAKRAGSSPSQPEGFDEYKPSGKKGAGPSMKERLLAARRAAEDEADAAASTAKEPVKKARSTAKSAGQRVTKTGTGAASAAKGVASARPGAARKAAPGGRGAVTPVRRASARSTAAGDSGDEAARPRSSRRRAEPPQKKKSPAPIIGGIVALGVVAIGAWKFAFTGEDEGTTTTGAGDTVLAAGSGSAGTGLDGAAGGLENPADTLPVADEGTPETSADEQAALDAAKASEDDEPAMGSLPESDGPATAAPRDRKGKQIVYTTKEGLFSDKYPDSLYDPTDPTEPQLTEFPKFEAPAGTSEEEWAEIEALALKAIDPLAGAAGRRAAIKLVEIGRPAYPGVINAMLDIDYSTAEGNSNGHVSQKICQDIAKGKNVGWYYGFDDTPHLTEIMNRRAVEKLHKVWQRCLDEDGYWERMTGSGGENPDLLEAAEKPEDDATKAALDALDELDDF